MGTIKRSLTVVGSMMLSLGVLLALLQPCGAKETPYVPESLQPWTEWVLHDKTAQRLCIPNYNNSKIFQCSWPGKTEIELDDTGGHFRQSWLVQQEGWFMLPGDSVHWPQDLLVDGESQIILQKKKRPVVKLSAGTHEVTGNFVWSRLPEKIHLPVDSAIVALKVGGRDLPFSNVDSSGRLWLKKKVTAVQLENRLKIESFRLIDDSIPAKVELFFTLDVAGFSREIVVGPLFDPGTAIPLALRSGLPAKLEQDGRLRIQVRPGQYRFNLELRHVGMLETLLFSPPEDGYWPQQEIWSFQAEPDLRQVELSGVPAIDPAQTSLPAEWQTLPAYQILPGQSLVFKEIKRGDPHPAPDQLSLDRNIWLRFDGSGYTFQDTIKGKKNTNWRLTMDPAISLGRVAVDGKEQLITEGVGSEKAGVELRNGLLRLTADSLYDGSITHLPAVGWQHDFQHVKGTLNLPPGWELLHSTGIDNISKTWVKGWSLLDIFMVLIFTIALANLFSKPLAVIAFCTMVLTYHEFGAPRFVWLALLLGFALLKYLPEGKCKKLAKIYQIVAFLTLIFIAIPYSINALRVGVYPQLAQPWTSMNTGVKQHVAPQQVEKEVMMEQMSDEVASPVRSKSKKMYSLAVGSNEASLSLQRQKYLDQQVMQYDPNVLNQTGPGIPTWRAFQTVPFSWSGPVSRDQVISFFLIGPKVNMILAYLRVVLIVVLMLGMCGFRYKPGKGCSFERLKSLTTGLLLVFVLLVPQLGQCAEMPSAQLLNELQERLLEPDQCFPNCADIADLALTITPTELVIVARVSAPIDTAIPIPSDVQQWLPQQVMVDGKPAVGLLRKGNGFWLAVPEGMHTIHLKGALRKQNMVQLPFPLQPHLVSINAEGWTVEGMRADGTVGGQLQFKRILDEEDGVTEILETGVLPSFVRVERNILLGLVWKVQTTVTRLSPLGSSVMLDIPILPGESVTTDGIRVVDGDAKVNLRGQQREVRWESFLQPTEQILLQHKETERWTEVWTLDVSPIFHLEYDGIPVIHHKSGERWFPTWHPWPGETVQLDISRPVAVKGQTLTVEKSHLLLRPGQKTTAATLSLSLASSQGGQHTITLPADATLQEVKIAGKVQPVRQVDRQVSLPITPGLQYIELSWIEARGMSTKYQSSALDLGAPSVNASVDIKLSRDRWPLFVGGDYLMGPAVLFWSVLFVIVLIAFGLSRLGRTPLKFYHWLLLAIGLCMSQLFAGAIVVLWLLALDWRGKDHDLEDRQFQAMQVGLVVLTVAALGSIVFAISQGLLGHPDMNISGNGSSSGLLRWYHDVSGDLLPRAWVISIPMFVYRIAMLAWALWISFWLVGIIKWGWQQFVTPKMWVHVPVTFKLAKPVPSKKKDASPQTTVDK